jgi:CDP-diacylglycerol pyrophosphatase
MDSRPRQFGLEISIAQGRKMTIRRKEAGWAPHGNRFARVLPLAFAVALSLPSLPARADPDALWRIVHDGCVPHVEAGQGPKPCEAVDLDGGVPEGVAILKDINGVAQMLAIPTRKITGVDDPQMLAADAPPVFADAWKAKPLLESRLGGKPLPREAVALTLNSKWARSQQQLHVHVDCVAEPVAAALAGYRPALDERWRPMTVQLGGRTYFARRLDSVDLADAEPLKLLAAGVDGARANMGAWTLAAVGAEFDGKPGFILLADVFSLEGGGHAEDLQDHDCAIARTAP